MNRIPKTFQLAGLTITIEIDKKFIDKHECIGQALYASQRIVLDDGQTPVQTTEQAAVHELVHWILHMMGEEKLCNNVREVLEISQRDNCLPREAAVALAMRRVQKAMAMRRWSLF